MVPKSLRVRFCDTTQYRLGLIILITLGELLNNTGWSIHESRTFGRTAQLADGLPGIWDA